MKFKKLFQKGGFTLIELLVVISIIGLLSSVVLASLNHARSKGQDAAIISNVKSLKTALELYYLDNNNYPIPHSAGVVLSNATLKTALVPKYIGSIPALLISNTANEYYSDGSQYGLKITTSSTTCKTGVSNTSMATNSWWTPPVLPVCNF